MEQMARLQGALSSERDKNSAMSAQLSAPPPPTPDPAALQAQKELADSMAQVQAELEASKRKMEEMAASGDDASVEAAAELRKQQAAMEEQLASEAVRLKEMEAEQAARLKEREGLLSAGMDAANLQAQQMMEKMQGMEAGMAGQLTAAQMTASGMSAAQASAAEAEQKAASQARSAARAARGSGQARTRVQRKLDAKVEFEELKGRVGALTIRMGRLTKLLSMFDGADDIGGLLRTLREEKVELGLGRTVALHRRSSASYHIH
jgi:hypothetical protein